MAAIMTEHHFSSTADHHDSPHRPPSAAQLAWLRCGLAQPGGKLPLFDYFGHRVPTATVRACLKAGWIEPWFHNPLKPDWDVCRLTATGRSLLAETHDADSHNAHGESEGRQA
ncbi:Mrr_N domain-containing protein [Azospirillaceae bacterium]